MNGSPIGPGRTPSWALGCPDKAAVPIHRHPARPGAASISGPPFLVDDDYRLPAREGFTDTHSICAYVPVTLGVLSLECIHPTSV